VNSGTAGITFGAVTETGTGITTFTVNNPANGGTTLLTLPSIATVAAGTVTFNGSGNTLVTGIIGNNSSGVTMSGTGTLTLQGANTFTGTLTMSGIGGTLVASGTNVGTLGNAATGIALSAGNLDLQSSTTTGVTYTNSPSPFPATRRSLRTVRPLLRPATPTPSAPSRLAPRR